MDSNSYTVFVAGVHGVGKGVVCKSIAHSVNACHVTASSLIKRAIDIGTSKATSGIDDNQRVLVMQYNELAKKEGRILLDGHFCLLRPNNKVEKLPVRLFSDLRIDKILLATCDPEVIYQRMISRDGHSHNMSISDISHFQNEEISQARYVAAELSIPISVIDTLDKASAESAAIRLFS